MGGLDPLVEAARYVERIAYRAPALSFMNSVPGSWHNWRIAAAAPLLKAYGDLDMVEQLRQALIDADRLDPLVHDILNQYETEINAYIAHIHDAHN